MSAVSRTIYKTKKRIRWGLRAAGSATISAASTSASAVGVAAVETVQTTGVVAVKAASLTRIAVTDRSMIGGLIGLVLGWFAHAGIDLDKLPSLPSMPTINLPHFGKTETKGPEVAVNVPPPVVEAPKVEPKPEPKVEIPQAPTPAPQDPNPNVAKAPDSPVQPPVVLNPPEPLPIADNPPKGSVMYGFQGQSGVFDADAFRQFAMARGYLPVLVTPWNSVVAAKNAKAMIKALPKGTAYALYGFSLGAQTARDVAEQTMDNPPVLVVTVGASSVISMVGSFSELTKQEHFFHTGTRHDVPGTYINAKHSGAGNIQQVIANRVKAKPPTPPLTN